MEIIHLPFSKDDLIFKRQASINNNVIWVYLKTEKSLQTKNYTKDSSIYIETPIMRFNRNSQVGIYMNAIYNIDYLLTKDQNL